MWKVMLPMFLLTISVSSFSEEILIPEEEPSVVAEESVSSRTGPRTKWESIEKMHNDGMFRENSWTSVPSMCGSNFANEIPTYVQDIWGVPCLNVYGGGEPDPNGNAAEF